MIDKTDSNKKALLSALVESRGIVTDACKKAGLSRETFYQYCKLDPDFASAVEDAKEQAIDYVEGKLYDLIENEDTTATIFFLKTRGKHRGYSERIEHTGIDNAPIKIEVDFKNSSVDELTKLIEGASKGGDSGSD